MGNMYNKLKSKVLENSFVMGICNFMKKHRLNIIVIVVLILATVFFNGEILFWIYMTSIFLIFRKAIMFVIKKLAKVTFKDANFEYPETEKFGNGLMVTVLLLTVIVGIIINTIDLTKQISTLSFALMILNIILISAIEPIYGIYMIDMNKKYEDTKEYKTDLRAIKVFGMISMISIAFYVIFVFSIETSNSNYSKEITFEKNPISKKQAEKEGQFIKLDNGKYYKVHVQSK